MLYELLQVHNQLQRTVIVLMAPSSRHESMKAALLDIIWETASYAVEPRSMGLYETPKTVNYSVLRSLFLFDVWYYAWLSFEKISYCGSQFQSGLG